MNPTQRERRHKAPMELHPGVTSSGGRKRKLDLTTEDDQPQGPGKRPKIFTGNAEDLVKLFGQYSQASTAAVQPQGRASTLLKSCRD